MTTQQQNMAANGTKRYVNIAIKMRGFLLHDNKYFDRTCPSCGGLFTSYVHASCPKCNQPLTFITAPNGKPMGISEGTFNPLLSEKTKARLERNLTARKNAVPIKYRFKIFSFVDDKGILSPPPEHMYMKSGALVEILIINHPAEATSFLTKELKPMVELMHKIYTGYGDSIKVVREPKAKAESTVAYKVDAAGNPVPVAPPFGTGAANPVIDEMQKRVSAIQAEIDKMRSVQAPPVLPVNAGVAAAADAAAQEFWGEGDVNLDDVADYEDVEPF
jgi:hypothetical protein